MISDVFMFWELGEFWFFDLQPGLGSALCGVAMLLLFRHVRPANPVLILRLALQMLQGVAFHLPGNLSWTPVLSDPLLPRDALPQQGKGEKHDGKVFLEKQNGSASESLWHYLRMQKIKRKHFLHTSWGCFSNVVDGVLEAIHIKKMNSNEAKDKPITSLYFILLWLGFMIFDTQLSHNVVEGQLYSMGQWSIPSTLSPQGCVGYCGKVQRGWESHLTEWFSHTNLFCLLKYNRYFYINICQGN